MPSGFFLVCENINSNLLQVNYYETFEAFAIKIEDLCNDRITLDDFYNTYNELGTELALKEANVNAEINTLAS